MVLKDPTGITLLEDHILMVLKDPTGITLLEDHTLMALTDHIEMILEA